MNQSAEQRPSAAERISNFLAAYRVAITIIGSAIIVAVVASVALFQLRAGATEQSAEHAELVSDLWSDWQESRPPTTTDDSVDDGATEANAEHDRIDAELDDAITIARDEFAGQYADLRATFIAAERAFVAEEWSDARTFYIDLVDRFPASHLVAPALAAAAAAAEEDGDLTSARALWQRIADGEGAPSLEAPRALFNLGRLAETANERDAAVAYYERLIDEHPSSSWTSLGRNRILLLASRESESES